MIGPSSVMRLFSQSLTPGRVVECSDLLRSSWLSGLMNGGQGREVG